ncbi:MAG: DUF1801 domain-containing protein [Pseudomonadota bacterium]
MSEDILQFNQGLSSMENSICQRLFEVIERCLPDADRKIWHRHTVWFLDDNPIVGYKPLKAGIRLMFWSEADFGEDRLQVGTGKFKDASILYRKTEEIDAHDLERWLELARSIQWDYRNIYKRKGRLERL